MLEIKKDHLHEHQHEHAAQSEQRNCGHVRREDGEEQGGEDRWAIHEPSRISHLETFQLSEAHRAPAHQPTARGADNRPADRQQDRCHGCRVSRIALTGAARPVHTSKDLAPWARSTSQPSAVRRPRERALRTSGVPPVTYTRSMTAPWLGNAAGRIGISSRRPRGVAFTSTSAALTSLWSDGSSQPMTVPGRSPSSWCLETKVRWPPASATADARAAPRTPRRMASARLGSSPTEAIAT